MIQSTVSIALFFYLVLTTVSGWVTTYASLETIHLIRLFAAGLVFTSATIAVTAPNVKQLVVVSLAAYSLTSMYAVITASLSGSLVVAWAQFPIDLIICVYGLILYSARQSISYKVFPDSHIVLYIIYAFVMLALTFIHDGIYLDFPPHFIFDVGSDAIERQETYSLGLTSFFAIASILSTMGLLRAKNSIEWLVYLCCILIFFICSLLSGGRGELFIGALIIIALLTERYKARFAGVLILAAITTTSSFKELVNSLEGVVIIDRFKTLLEGDLSSRDSLVKQSFELLSDKPQCLLHGCGLGYFQAYYGYDFSLYPHNSLVEAVLTFGFPITFAGLFLVIRGMLRYHRKVGEFDIFLAIFYYSALVSLKSGYLFGSWVLIVGSFYLIAVGIVGFPSQVKKINPQSSPVSAPHHSPAARQRNLITQQING